MNFTTEAILILSLATVTAYGKKQTFSFLPSPVVYRDSVFVLLPLALGASFTKTKKITELFAIGVITVMTLNIFDKYKILQKVI